MLSGDNSILSKAGEAKNDSIVSKEKEYFSLAYNAALMKNLGDAVDRYIQSLSNK